MPENMECKDWHCRRRSHTFASAEAKRPAHGTGGNHCDRHRQNLSLFAFKRHQNNWRSRWIEVKSRKTARESLLWWIPFREQHHVIHLLRRWSKSWHRGYSWKQIDEDNQESFHEPLHEPGKSCGEIRSCRPECLVHQVNQVIVRCRQLCILQKKSDSWNMQMAGHYVSDIHINA